MIVEVLKAGPGVTIQDQGRAGLIAQGLSRGGAVDRLALLEAEALLKRRVSVIELAGAGASFRIGKACRIALTGAQRKVNADGNPLRWNASHNLAAGTAITVSAGQGYAYVAFDAALDVPEVIGSQSAHLKGGIGGHLEPCELHFTDARIGTSDLLDVVDRAAGGTVRFMAGPQTDAFGEEALAAFTNQTFTKSARSNRQGAGLDGTVALDAGQLSRISDFITEGDIQITGNGAPFVLLAECQTIGGYPRIGTVLPCDIPVVAQAKPGAELRFELVSTDEAEALWRSDAQQVVALRNKISPLLRDPATMHDLLSYQLVSGFIRGDEEWL